MAEESGRPCGNASSGGEAARWEHLLKQAERFKHPQINVNVFDTRYWIVKRVCESLGWGITGVGATERNAASNTCWSMGFHDCGGSTAEGIMPEMNQLQKINHFPGVSRICQKCKLGTTLNRLASKFPHLFDFHPMTFVLPSERESLQRWYQIDFAKKKQRPVLIAKPDGGCQGQGIFLTNDLTDLDERLLDAATPTAIQEYMSQPYLINGYKFDLRIYCLITSCSPKLRAFQHKSGLVRFATKKYVKPSEDNMAQVHIHLTNYAVNKNNSKGFSAESDSSTQNSSSSDTYDSEVEDDDDDDEEEEEMKEVSHRGMWKEAWNARGKWISQSGDSEDDTGVKWSLNKFYKYLSKQGKDVGRLKLEIQNVVTKTLLSIQHNLSQEYKAVFPTEASECARNTQEGFRCFEILGFDVILDKNLKPFVLEVNHSPSLHCDSKLDTQIKFEVIREAMILGSVDPDDLLNGQVAPRPMTAFEQRESLGKLLASRSKPAKVSHGEKGKLTLESPDAKNEEPASTEDDGALSSRSATMQNNNANNDSSDSDSQSDSQCEVDNAVSRKETGPAIPPEATRLEVLRTRFEDSHRGGWERVLPYFPEHPYAADYREIENHLPALYKESPVTMRRRLAAEEVRKKMLEEKLRHELMVGDRPKWGVSGVAKAKEKSAELAELKRSMLQEQEQDQRRPPAPLPRVALLPPGEYSLLRLKQKVAERSDSPRRETSVPSRPAAPVAVQTLSFAFDAIPSYEKPSKKQPQGGFGSSTLRNAGSAMTRKIKLV